MSYRGRTGPSRSTPSSVQCQKCLKRERHYSYECKAAPQERPYVPRPSRTQQLLNPKLVPKLNTEVADELQRKKGIADAELAKREAEREKKRRLAEEDDEPLSPRPAPGRSRSASYDSASSISRSPPSPGPGRRASRSPIRARDNSPPARQQRPRADDFNRTSRSRSPEDYARPVSRREPSPRREARHSTRSRRGSSVSSRGYDKRDRRSAQGSYSRSVSRSRSPKRESRSRSPPAHSGRGYRERDDDKTAGRRRGQPTAPQLTRAAEPVAPPRERSLSPFSRRLALTQSMNVGR